MFPWSHTCLSFSAWLYTTCPGQFNWELQFNKQWCGRKEDVGLLIRDAWPKVCFIYWSCCRVICSESDMALESVNVAKRKIAKAADNLPKDRKKLVKSENWRFLRTPVPSCGVESAFQAPQNHSVMLYFWPFLAYMIHTSQSKEVDTVQFLKFGGVVTEQVLLSTIYLLGDSMKERSLSTPGFKLRRPKLSNKECGVYIHVSLIK